MRQLLMDVLSDSPVDIPLEKIRLGIIQARQRDIKVDPDDDLVHGIRKNGLLQPIVVKKSPDGNYDIILGQRRFRAHEILKMSTIKAYVIKGDIDDFQAKKLSLNENAGQKAMKPADYTDAIEMFMKRYPTTKTVAEELGLSTATVRKYIRFSRLPKSIQDKVNTKEMGLDNALKALDALGGDETQIDPKLLLDLIQEIEKLSGPAGKKLATIIKHEPDIRLSVAVEKAKTRITHKIIIETSDEQFSKITKFKEKKEFKKQEDAASELIDIGLEVVENQ